MDKITILQTSDIHGYLSNHDFINNRNWGLYSLTGIINQYAKADRLLIDSGDFLQGSPLTHYAYENQAEIHPVIELFNAIGYDALTFGNHEFNYGLDFLVNSLKGFAGTILSANIQGMEKLLPIKPYQIFEKKGVKIAVIGLTTKYIPNWEKAENITDLTFLSPVEVYAKYEAEMQAKADIIIVNYHGGLEYDISNLEQPTEKLTGENQGSELLKKFTSIDILLTGHQHRNFACEINGITTVQPANNGQFISKIEIDVATKKVIGAELIAADETTTDKELKKITADIEAKTEIYLDQILGHASKDMLVDDISRARREGHSLINLISKVQLEVSGAMISALSLFDSAVGFKTDITMRDLIANYPYPNTFVVVELTGKQLLEIMEISASYFIVKDGEIAINERFTKPKAQHYQYDIFYGIDYEIDASKPIGQKVQATYQGKAIDLTGKYTLVVNNYRASNVAWYPMYQEAKVIKEIDQDMVQLLTDYIRKHKIIEVDEGHNFYVHK